MLFGDIGADVATVELGAMTVGTETEICGGGVDGAEAGALTRIGVDAEEADAILLLSLFMLLPLVIMLSING